MNKKGFTLVELLAVIVILAIIIVIVAVFGFGAFGNAKEEINQENLNVITEAANFLVTEVKNCYDSKDEELYENLITTFAQEDKQNCDGLKEAGSTKDENGECLKITLQYLLENNYVSGGGVESIYKDYPNLYINACITNEKVDTNVVTGEKGEEPTTTTKKTTTAKIDYCKDIPYDKETLAYSIICNAKKVQNENNTTNAVYRDKPLIDPGKTTQKYSIETKESSEETTYDITKYKDYYWTYGTGYKINTSTGKFELTNVNVCKYSESGCLTDLLKSGKTVYLAYTSSSSASSTEQTRTTTGLSYVYRLIEAPKSTTETIILKSKKITNIPLSYESTLSVTTDNYGDSYYYRGNVKDNYINFAGMCWRIVRIQGDGSIRLILEDQDQLCSESMNSNFNYQIDENNKNFNFGYETTTDSSGNSIDKVNFLNPVTNSNKALVNAFKTFQTNKLSSVLSKLKSGDWCYDDSGYESDKKTLISNISSFYTAPKTIYFGANVRLTAKNPSLKCNKSFLTKFNDGTAMYVGTLTADEVSFAGAALNTANTTYYLMDKSTTSWWTLSPHVYSQGPWEVHSYHVLGSSGVTCFMCAVHYTDNARPAITLKSGTLLNSGDGTITNPYVIG